MSTIKLREPNRISFDDLADGDLEMFKKQQEDMQFCIWPSQFKIKRYELNGTTYIGAWASTIDYENRYIILTYDAIDENKV